ncbi:MAG: glycoside hydrolase family 127 protein [Verrucomicrobiales bacterium]|nr:glycoside hydrolase family 127 protein [Verrucomicrobiales bacterium]
MAKSHFAVVEPINPGDARWTAGFWAARFELCRTQTIPALERIMAGTNHSHFIRNFEIAAGLTDGPLRGAPFNDGEVYKWIEAAAATLALAPDQALERRVDELIELIARAQRADGYIHTPVLIRHRKGDTNAVPFADRNNFELYNMGHLMLAAAAHWRVTGKTNLLAVARKAADFLCAAFEQVTPEGARGSVCPSHFMGLVELYRVTGDARYLALAQKLFELRFQVTDGSDENQDRLPFAQQTEPVGHAVRANYLYAGAADLFLETGDESLLKPLREIWTNLVRKKLYITGGCGALYDGASPDGAKDQKVIARVHQAYGRNYQLPNITAHSETCANIGNVLWNWRMFLITGEARFVDIIELTLYNSVLSGVSLDGTNFFYTNPLRVTEPMPVELRWPRHRVPFLGSFCCPPNLARVLARSPELAYATSEGAIWVNLYGASEFNAAVPGVGKVKLVQETEYPWSGRVRVRIVQPGTNEFTLKLRVPGWVRHPARVRVNLRPVELELTPGEYVELRRAWHAGDIVDLDLPMQAELIEANPLVEETFGQVAVKRGPIVYCLESADLPSGVRVTQVLVPADAELRARYDARLLGGVVVIDTSLLYRTNSIWEGDLYRPFAAGVLRRVSTKFVPYCVWGNRGRGEMSVWLPISQR